MKLILIINLILIAKCYESNFNVTPVTYEEDLSQEKSEMQPKSSITYSYEDAIYGEYIYQMNISKILDDTKRFLYQEIIEANDEVDCQIVQNQITLEKKLGLEYSLDVVGYGVVTERVEMKKNSSDESGKLEEEKETAEKIKKVFLITKELDLINLTPNDDENKFNYEQEIQLIDPSPYEENKNIFLKIFNQKILIIVSNCEIVTVPITITRKTDIIYQESFMQEQQLQQISSIQLFQIFQTNYLFINANTEGLIIYEIDSEGKMAQISHSINEELQSKGAINITDTAIINETLYCLDYNYGLHAISLNSSLQISKNHGFIIPKIKKGKQLAQHENTLIIPTDQDSSLNNQAAIYEVFVYPPDKWILNHEEFYPSTLKRVEIGNRYYLAIFSATHLIIPHSMFAEFMPVNFDTYISKYAFSHLQFGQFINDEFTDAENPQLLHITSNGIYKHEFEESSFSIKCLTTENAQSQTVTFENQFIARRCSKKDNARDESNLNACLLKKKFVISVFHYIKESETKWVVLVVIASVLVFIFLVSLALYIWYKNCYKPISNLEKKIGEMKKIKYDTLKNAPEVEQS